MSEHTPINERLKACRKACNLTQKDVAAALNVNRSTYTYYETSRSTPSIDTLGKLSVIFNVPIEVLLGIEKKPDDLRDNPFGDLPAEDDKIEVMYFNKLSKEEQHLILGFRMLKKTQREEILASFGFYSEDKSRRKKI